jgi:hypothetical protein
MVKVVVNNNKGLVQSAGDGVTFENGVINSGNVRLRSGATAAGAPSLMVATQAHAEVANGNQLITITQLKTGVLADDPEGNANWTLPTAALLVAGLPGYAVGDCLDFSVINEATSAADEKITVVMGTGGTAVGLLVVDSQLVAGIRGAGSGMFRIRITSATAYTCYRLA